MKKCWKIALAVATVAGLIPYSYKKDEESGASVLQALLWSCAKKPDGGTDISIGLHIGSMPLPKATADHPEACPEECSAECSEECHAESEEAPAEIF